MNEISNEEIRSFLQVLKKMIDADYIDFGLKRGAFRDRLIFLDSFGWVQNGAKEKIGFWMDFVQDENDSEIDEIDWNY